LNVNLEKLCVSVELIGSKGQILDSKNGAKSDNNAD